MLFYLDNHTSIRSGLIGCNEGSIQPMAKRRDLVG